MYVCILCVYLYDVPPACECAHLAHVVTICTRAVYLFEKCTVTVVPFCVPVQNTNQWLNVLSFQDRDNNACVTGEEWLVKKVGAYLPGAYGEVVDVVDAYILTKKVWLCYRLLVVFYSSQMLYVEVLCWCNFLKVETIMIIAIRNSSIDYALWVIFSFYICF